MSVAEFTQTLQSQVYKNWINTLDKSIIHNSVKSLRSSQEVADKTSFYFTEKNLKDMYKTLTGLNMETHDVQVFMQNLAKPSSNKKGALEGQFIKVAGSNAVLFESIGFDTISKRLVKIFDEDGNIQERYKKVEEDYYDAQIAELNKDKTLKGKAKQKEIDDIAKEAKRRGSFGGFFNKGHVVGVATNLVKHFKDEVAATDKLAENQRNVLIQVLDKYIDKLQKDDLASANLPDAVNQELYASYIKSSNKYLVEIQYGSENIEAGRASIPFVTELRKLFSVSESDLASIVTKSPALGESLLTTKGSPSYVDILVKELADMMVGKNSTKQVYQVKDILIGKKTTKIQKPKKNTQKIQELKGLKSKLKAVKKDPKQFVEATKPTYSLANLLVLLQDNIQNVVSANMGDGNERNILNYRTGRFAASVQVESLSESRQGMITAFYRYMNNPYATFSEGGRQQNPKSRDPKLLIAKSIRELAATVVGNRLRAVQA